MVSEEEIEKVTKLMKIYVTNHREFIDKVHTMIDYFDLLDKAGVEDEEISMFDTSLSSLREDVYIPYETKLIKNLKNYKGTYVRAPKMI